MIVIKTATRTRFLCASVVSVTGEQTNTHAHFTDNVVRVGLNSHFH